MPPVPNTSACTLHKAVYVACNVYVSAGGEKGHASLLLNLLQKAQSACQAGNVGVVHAYADKVYNRSSFHLVGEAEPLSVVAANLASEAIQSLRSFSTDTGVEENQVHHPYVGFVDHVAIMPVGGVDSVEEIKRETLFKPSTPSGIAARYVGKVLEEAGVRVYYYGSAHPKGTPLATIRREKTQFFKSGGLSDPSKDCSCIEVATVGAPLGFVENYNIRLKATCPKMAAQSLTKLVRERDGGLAGVEALTLPYSNGRWEVACNLLHPSIASARDIDNVVKAWESEVSENYVETAYRVGTTADQCLKAISTFDDAMWKQYNSKVEARLRGDLEGA